MAQPMVLETLLAGKRVELDFSSELDCWVHFIHQPAYRAPNQMSSRPQNV